MESEFKQAFKSSWEKDLPSHEVPCLDFLSSKELAGEQLRYSAAVINDCLTTLKLEVFIVKFLRSHLFSDEEQFDIDLGTTVGYDNLDEVVDELYSVFPTRRRNVSDGSCYSKVSAGKKKRTNISKFQFPNVSTHDSHDHNKQVDIHTENTSDLDAEDSSLNEGKESNKHGVTSVAVMDGSKASSKSERTRRSTSPKSNSASSNDETPGEMATSPNKITIFTPVEDKHVELKIRLSSGEITVPNSSTFKPTGGENSVGSVECTREQEERFGSNGSELDINPSLHGDTDSSSPDCGSSIPVRHPYFGNTSSDEVLDILPISATRHSFYRVDPSFEGAKLGTAEHVYEDIEKYFKASVQDELDEVKPVAQPELHKTYSVGFNKKKRDEGDDVFVKAEQRSPDGHETAQALQPPSYIPTVHKRSSSDAGISYSIRPITSRQRQARKDRVAFQVHSDQGVPATFTDGNLPSIQSPLEQAVDDAHNQHMRKWVVAGLVDSERGYLEALDKLVKPMKPIKASITTSSPICTIFEFHKIYNKVEDLHKIHSQFLTEMEQRVANWGYKQIIGDIFTALTDQFGVYQEYVRNNPSTMETIRKCKSSEQFKGIFTQEITLLSTQELVAYENLFHKPLERIARYIFMMDDLVKYTSEDHPDYDMLQMFMKRAQDFLQTNFVDGHNIRVAGRVTKKKKYRKLLKDGFVVELVEGQRKFRHLFLYSDIFVSTKLKVTNRGEHFAIKWHCPISDIQFVPTANSESAPSVPVSSNFEIDHLKAKIAAIKADIRQEQGMSEGYTSKELERSAVRTLSTTSINSVSSRSTVPSTTKTMERYKRKLAEQEAALWLALPSLPLTIYRRSGKTHRFLFSTDVARGDWKREILSHKEKGKEAGIVEGAAIFTGTRSSLSPLEIEGLAETCLEMRTVRSLGSVNLKDDDNVFTGVLYVVVSSGKGFIKPLDFYVVLEVDYYGHYVRKAKTKVSRASQDPSWEQGFHIEVEGTQFVRVLCYNKSRMMIGDELCGVGTVKLEKKDLADCHYHDYTVILDKQGCILISIQYSTTLEGIHHRRSVSSNGVFGVSLEQLVEREKSDIPLVVIACCREVERRGVKEVGIYRVSGVSSDVKRLKEKFDENSQEAVVYISEADIHAVAGTVKQYFRELPDPLFTTELYPKFIEALGNPNEEEKEKYMLELLEKLPAQRKCTALFLIDHLRRVSQFEEENKMSLGNLATIFGPNLLRPPPTEKPADTNETSTSIAFEMVSGTLNVMSQTSVFYWYLRSKNSKVGLQTTPEITRRLFPAKKEIVIPRLSSQSDDVLI